MQIEEAVILIHRGRRSTRRCGSAENTIIQAEVDNRLRDLQ